MGFTYKQTGFMNTLHVLNVVPNGHLRGRRINKMDCMFYKKFQTHCWEHSHEDTFECKYCGQKAEGTKV